MSLLKQQINYLGIGLSLCTFLSGGNVYATDPAAPDERAEASRVAPLPVHNYLEVAYDVRAYDGIVDRAELFRIFIGHSRAIGDYRETGQSCSVEEDWKNTQDVLQVFYARHLRVPYTLGEISAERAANSIFTYPNSVVNSIKKGGCQDDVNRGDVLFYHWKQAAWVDCDVANQLVQALREGFQDLIPARPQWAAYWHQRAEILRAQPQWYKPISTARE